MRGLWRHLQDGRHTKATHPDAALRGSPETRVPDLWQRLLDPRGSQGPHQETHEQR